MIMVDVYVASLNKSFDFGIEPEASVAAVIEEIVEMICQNEQYSMPEAGDFALCCLDSQKILSPQSAIAANGIQTGNRLLLV